MNSVQPESVTETDGPVPRPMSVDTQRWLEGVDRSNFVNAWATYRDLRRLGNVQSILVIGPGQGLEVVILRWREYHVVTFDIDATFSPDVIGSCHDLSMFSDAQFDAVVVSHVLEHLPIGYLDRAIAEIARVGKHALIYLPITGRHSQLRLIPGFKGIDWSIVVNWFNPFRRPSAQEPLFCGGQHYWEIGRRGFRLSQVRQRLAKSFCIQDCYRNADWLPSMNFILRSRHGGGV